MKKILTFMLMLTAALMCLSLSKTVKAAETTVSTTVADYAKANSWSNETKYTSITLDANVTVSVAGGGNTGKYYTSGSDWRLYQTENATLKIQLTGDYILKSITITYSNNNSGVLLDSANNKLTSSTTLALSKGEKEYTFSVGNTETKTNGAVRVTKISVSYDAASGTVDPYQTAINNYETSLSLSFAFNSNSSIVETSLSGYSTTAKNTKGDYDLTTYFTLPDLKSVMYKYNEASYSYYKDGDIRLYKGTNGNGSSIEFTFNNPVSYGGVNAYDTNTTPTVIDGLTVTFSEDRTVVKIQNTSADTMKISKFEFVTFGPTDASNVRLRLAVSSSLIDEAGIDDFGIYVVDSNNVKKRLSFFTEDRYEDTAAGLTYVVVDLGDLFAHPDRYDLKFTLNAYIMVDTTYYDSSKLKRESVNTILAAYLKDTGVTAEQEAMINDFVSAILARA